MKEEGEPEEHALQPQRQARRAICSGGGGSEDSGGGSRKKLRLSKDQAAVLEDTFKEHNTVNPISKQTNNQKAEGGAGEAVESEAVAGGGVVPEQEGENEAEADGGGQRAALRQTEVEGVKVDLLNQRGQVGEGGRALGRTVDFGPFSMAQDAVSDSN
ncbi:Os09g0562300 [Oryza sativa Japonica Group]|uniref:Os09g0562300 protein n=1 Tax=Oryza sativa subsp. japonica TaxID=39947 RepID=B9FJ45_ORYSJ|nr:hypothetical protein OsJ_17604 [Oryza sativa Japonica Group]BAH94709.1 Os09g0562300 [Oryza sativa Japonica Group]|eukprot:NP_001175981.1 Os09g0562300 [Oryza sativa Japonica Group]